jgi:hypothetical protein
MRRPLLAEKISLNEKTADIPSFGGCSAAAGLWVVYIVVAYENRAYVETPIGPNDEYYPHNWGFQLIVGGVYCVALLALTAGVIAVERSLIDLFSRSSESDSARK